VNRGDFPPTDRHPPAPGPHPGGESHPECVAALRVLDLARPGEGDAVAVARAEGHLVNCPHCREVVVARQQFDQRVAQLLDQTEVPVAGLARLKRKLAAARAPSDSQPVSHTIPPPNARSVPAATAAALVSLPVPAGRAGGSAALAASAIAAPSNDRVSTSPHHTAVSRRRVWLQRGGAVVALLLLAWLSVWWQAQPQTSFSRLVGALAQLDWSQLDWKFTRLAPLQTLQNGAEPRLPDEIETRQIAMGPGTLEVDRVQAAVFLFRFTRRGANQVQAALAVIPVNQVRDANAHQRFLGVPPLVEGDLCATTWVEGDLAYVCCVKGNRSDLQELARPRPAA
jgi:hypothetical protein